MVERHSCLIVVDGQLQQNVELVRIDLRAVAIDGKEFQLRLSSEILRDGRARGRNQKLASKVSANLNVQETVNNCFASRFGLTPDLQKQVMEMDESAYSY